MDQLSNKDRLNGEFFFHTPIYYKDLSNSKELNKHLLKHIKLWKKRDEKGIIRSNSLGWHSAVDMHNRKEYNPLTKELFKMQHEIFEAEGYSKKTEPVCDNMWANVNLKYSHNKNHVHPGAQWSGVYYIQTPKDCGNIIFYPPHIDVLQANWYNEEKNSLYNYSNFWMPSITNRLYLFPNWLRHGVESNMNKDEERISLSFNIT